MSSFRQCGDTFRVRKRRPMYHPGASKTSEAKSTKASTCETMGSRESNELLWLARGRAVRCLVVRRRWVSLLRGGNGSGTTVSRRATFGLWGAHAEWRGDKRNYAAHSKNRLLNGCRKGAGPEGMKFFSERPGLSRTVAEMCRGAGRDQDCPAVVVFSAGQLYTNQMPANLWFSP